MVVSTTPQGRSFREDKRMKECNTMNRHFAKLVERCWHEWDYHGPHLSSQPNYVCRICHAGTDTPNNPDFVSNPTLVLVEMMKREDWPTFAMTISCWFGEKSPVPIAIPLKYISDTTEGLLVRAAIEFLKGWRS